MPEAGTGDLRVLAAKILALFADSARTLDSAFDLQERLREAFYRFLTKRYGARARFDFLKPQPREPWEEGRRTNALIDALIFLPLEERQKLVAHMDKMTGERKGETEGGRPKAEGRKPEGIGDG